MNFVDRITVCFTLAKDEKTFGCVFWKSCWGDPDGQRYDILYQNKILQILLQELQLFWQSSNLLYGGAVHLGFRMTSPPAQSGIFFSMDSEVLNQIQSEIRQNKETAIRAGVHKQDQKEIKLLFGVNENQYSSLQKLLHVSVYVLRFVKQRVWNQINVDK